jgi:hypothetical protein
MYTCRRGLSLIYLVEYSEVSASCSRDKAARDLGDDYGSAKTKSVQKLRCSRRIYNAEITSAVSRNGTIVQRLPSVLNHETIATLSLTVFAFLLVHISQGHLPNVLNSHKTSPATTIMSTRGQFNTKNPTIKRIRTILLSQPI